MASVREKNGRWLMIWSVREPGGGRQQKTRMFNGPSKRAALKEARRLEDEARALTAPAGNEMVDDFLSTWLEAHATKVSICTIERYRELCALAIPHIGKLRLDAICPLDLERLYAGLLANGGKGGRPLSAKTVGHVHAALRKASRDAVRWGRLSHAPTDGARPPRSERTPPAVSTPADLHALLAAIDDSDLAALVELAALTGARKQELLALEWSDIDLTGSRLTISKAVEETRRGVRVKPPKTGAGSRTIHLPERAATSLRTHRKRQLELRMRLGEWPYGALVFPDYKGGGVRSPRCVSQAVWRARKRAGITGGTLLGFRHAHATELLRAGVHPKVVQERLGHALDRCHDGHLRQRPAGDGPGRRRQDRAHLR